MLKYFVLFLIFTFQVSPVFAEGKKEVFVQGLGLGLMGGESEFRVTGGYNHPLFDFMQVGGGLSWQSFGHASTSVRVLKIQVGPTFNLGPYENTYFASLGYGIRSGTGLVESGKTEPNGGGLYLHIGQRLPIGNNLVWRPSAGIETGGGFHLIVHVLSIAYFF